MAQNGHASGGMNGLHSQMPAHIEALNERLIKTKYVAKFHEDELMSVSLDVEISRISFIVFRTQGHLLA